MSYNHLEIEKKWQAYWAKNKTFKTENTKDKPKFYALDMFPYQVVLVYMWGIRKDIPQRISFQG